MEATVGVRDGFVFDLALVDSPGTEEASRKVEDAKQVPGQTIDVQAKEKS